MSDIGPSWSSCFFLWPCATRCAGFFFSCFVLFIVLLFFSVVVALLGMRSGLGELLFFCFSLTFFDSLCAVGLFFFSSFLFLGRLCSVRVTLPRHILYYFACVCSCFIYFNLWLHLFNRGRPLNSIGFDVLSADLFHTGLSEDITMTFLIYKLTITRFIFSALSIRKRYILYSNPNVQFRYHFTYLLSKLLFYGHIHFYTAENQINFQFMRSKNRTADLTMLKTVGWSEYF